MVGGNIKDYLLENGISQKWLSEKTDIKIWKLTGSLNNKRDLTVIEYFKICLILKLPFDYFIPKSELLLEEKSNAEVM